MSIAIKDLASSFPCNSENTQAAPMSSIQAKIFEWHRLTAEAQAAESELKNVAGASKGAHDETRERELMARIDELRARARTLLAEIDQERSSPPPA
jgi:hypothetical protein